MHTAKSTSAGEQRKMAKHWRLTASLLGGVTLLAFAPFGAAIDLPLGFGCMGYAVFESLRLRYAKV